MAFRILTVDLAEPPPDLGGCDAYEALWALVRFQGRTLGWARLNHAGRPHVSATWLRNAAAEQVTWELLPHVLLPAYTLTPSALPPIAVVVYHTTAPADLAACLEALDACRYAAYEVIVVDGSTAPETARRLVERFPHTRYLRAAQPGAAAARTQGAAAARFDLIACLDAACRPDSGWLNAIAAGFSVADVAAVSGPVAPDTLDTPAQILFETVFGGYGRATYTRTVRPATAGRHERFGGADMGSLRNMAFSRAALHALGGFSDDYTMLTRLLAGGMSLRYSGDALVWYTPPADLPTLRATLFARGRARGAAFLAGMVAGPGGRSAVLHYAGFVWVRSLLGRIRRNRGVAQRLAYSELLGALSSLPTARLSLTSPPGDATL
jgi:cellulose synthase/poly-beta-1,6-N-acetylglucosamine synthase-like glycosyltransferase